MAERKPIIQVERIDANTLRVTNTGQNTAEEVRVGELARFSPDGSKPWETSWQGILPGRSRTCTLPPHLVGEEQIAVRIAFVELQPCISYQGAFEI